MNLENYIKNNNLHKPDYNNENTLDLMKILYNRCGKNYNVNKNMQNLDKLIPHNKHIIFILIDGMGNNVLNKLEENNILRKNKVTSIQTVFPSSTACVLTSIFSCKYPNEHKIWGWYNYYPEKNICYYPLMFTDNENNSLLNHSIKYNDIFKYNSMLNTLKCDTFALFPDSINNSLYSNWVSKKRYSYNSIKDISSLIHSKITEKNSFTYLYLPYIDSLEHKYGYDSSKVIDCLKDISNQVNSLLSIPDTTIIIISDHGQIKANKCINFNYNKYSKYLYATPTIDVSTVSYFVKEIYYKEFEEEFFKDYNGKMTLFKKEEFINLNILGKEKITNIDNLGEYISLCENGYSFTTSNDFEIGIHSGLSKDEMIVPLIVINTNK